MKGILSCRTTIVTLLAAFACACHHREAPALFQLMDNTGIDFNNRVVDGKLANSFLFRNFYNGGGVAIGDVNNDGLADVLLTSNMGSNKLYLNKGNLHFEDITDKAGLRQDSMWSTGAVMADVDGDGWLDIYICNSGHMKDGHRRNQLYINNRNGTFTESAAKYGLDISAYTTQVSFFDYDGDGDLDCFMIDNSPIPVNTLNNANRRDLPEAEWPVAQFLKGGGDHLFRNDNGHFTEVTREAGIHGSLISFGLGVSVGDVNGDGWPDIFVSNDSYERDYLYINQGNGTFRDELEERIGHTSFSSMGADLADINNDGSPEIFTTDMLPGDDFRLKTLGAFDNIDLYNAKLKAGFYHQYMKNCLQLNDGTGHFMDVANYSGVSATDWSWGALIFDMNNDGLNDLFVCNGVNKDVTNLDFMDFFADDVLQKMVLTGKKDEIDDILKKIPVNPMPHKAFCNKGNLSFEDASAAWGFTHPSFANGAAYGDLDNDGDLDLVINNENGPAFVYQNNSRQVNGNHYIGFLLKGKDRNSFAVGSKIRVFSGGRLFYRELIPSRGFQSSMDYRQEIGLGRQATIDSVVITWPDRTTYRMIRPAADEMYSVAEPPALPTSPRRVPPGPVVPSAGEAPGKPAIDSARLLLRPVAASFDRHVEDDNTDFYYELNLPKMLSREGPKAASGDLDGDGLADVYIGGTKGHPGQVYLQTPDGRFVKKPEPGFTPFSDFEDEAVTLFDADNDGDLDLFVGPGGNASRPDSREMQFRLYLNDGKGNFTIDVNAFPNTLHGVNTGAAVAGDFNRDGYMDLFIGGRSVPREYGSTPSSLLFINDGHGHFTDIAASKNPDIAGIGMVTAAAYTDVFGDGSKDLVIAGEWMSPHFFTWKNDRFEEVKTDLSNRFGWWESMAVADLNGDGLPDLVLGNIGENFYLHPDSTHPVKLWINDFDQNGIPDKILTRSVDGRDMPVFLKREMERQLPSLKKRNLRHEQYAQKSIRDLLPADQLDSSMIRRFDFCPSVIALNRGHGRFDIQPLPVMVQLSSVNAIRCIDVNGDGKPDLVMGGNDFGFLPQFGRLDASKGHVLLGDGKGSFTWIPPSRSGVRLPGQIRDIEVLPGKKPDAPAILFLQNDEYPVLFRTQPHD
ncbi:MAG TPA: VCBS repeat-containing protein [Puia sp.]|nr:VCBS repeat-containing protein [Puia sp.]